MGPRTGACGSIWGEGRTPVGSRNWRPGSGKWSARRPVVPHRRAAAQHVAQHLETRCAGDATTSTPLKGGEVEVLRHRGKRKEENRVLLKEWFAIMDRIDGAR